MTDNTPTKPGYYWARWPDSINWEPVEMDRTGPGGSPRVWMVGCGEPFQITDLIWAPGGPLAEPGETGGCNG